MPIPDKQYWCGKGFETIRLPSGVLCLVAAAAMLVVSVLKPPTRTHILFRRWLWMCIKRIMNMVISKVTE